jgi:hypothetical protein
MNDWADRGLDVGIGMVGTGVIPAAGSPCPSHSLTLNLSLG